MGCNRQTSVLIPAYNCEASLAAAVESVINSELQDTEIIIVDDGSTDRTPEVCRELCGKYANVSAYRHDNAGVSAARNKAIELSHGDYILFIDSDDTVRPFDIDKLNLLMSDDVDVIAFGLCFRYQRGNKIVKEEVLTCGSDRILAPKELANDFEPLFDCNYLSTSCNKFIKRSILINSSIRFDGRLTNYEDLEFTMRLLPHITSFAALGEPYYDYRIEYGHDHTPERVAKIENIISNTDIIAQSFLAYCDYVKSSYGLEVPGLRKTLLTIYLNLIACKIRSCKYALVKRICADFAADEYIPELLDTQNELSDFDSYFLHFLISCRPLSLLCLVRCSSVRNSAAAMVKRILRIER